MKTKKQILEWLDKQPWKNEFYEEFFKHGNAMVFWGEDFIVRALDYKKSINMELWEERNENFNEWYGSANKPMSWEEYCEQNTITPHDWRIYGECEILRYTVERRRNANCDANVMSKELCEAFVAYMKLIQLRNAWVKEYNCMAEMCYKIITYDGTVRTQAVIGTNGLSFQTLEMATEFADTFGDLLEIAKPLL